MKREATTPEPSPTSSETAYTPEIASPQLEPKVKMAKTTSSPKTPTKSSAKKAASPASAKTPKSPKAENGTWTPEKRKVFVDEIFAAGYKATDLDSLAAKLDMDKRQLINQLVPNRSNFRMKAVKAVAGEQ